MNKTTLLSLFIFFNIFGAHAAEEPLQVSVTRNFEFEGKPCDARFYQDQFGAHFVLQPNGYSSFSRISKLHNEGEELYQVTHHSQGFHISRLDGSYAQDIIAALYNRLKILQLSD